jgi:PhnB protein
MESKYHTVCPWIATKNTDKLIEFLKSAFNAHELGRVYVDNGDVLYEQALKAGATSMTKMTTHSWGDRIGRICDPFGNIWWITTHVEDLSPDEIVKRSQQKEFIEAMEYAQNSFNPLCGQD